MSRSQPQTSGDFKCAHCHRFVSSAHWLSGVNNRNHCPYCLWSLHLDLYAAGDRLSACRAPMQSIALTTKRSRNKYNGGRGELMLVHQCTDCGELSINRIAADDDANALLDVFHASLTLPSRTLDLLLRNGIEILHTGSLPQFQLQLFGNAAGARIPETAAG